MNYTTFLRRLAREARLAARFFAASWAVNCKRMLGPAVSMSKCNNISNKEESWDTV
jgi:hypothetical protein